MLRSSKFGLSFVVGVLFNLTCLVMCDGASSSYMDVDLGVSVLPVSSAMPIPERPQSADGFESNSPKTKENILSNLSLTVVSAYYPITILSAAESVLSSKRAEARWAIKSLVRLLLDNDFCKTADERNTRYFIAKLVVDKSRAAFGDPEFLLQEYAFICKHFVSVDLSAVSDYKPLALVQSGMYCELQILFALNDAKFRKNAIAEVDKGGNSLLHHAARSMHENSKQVIELLIYMGADPLSSNDFEVTPYSLALSAKMNYESMLAAKMRYKEIRAMPSIFQ